MRSGLNITRRLADVRRRRSGARGKAAANGKVNNSSSSENKRVPQASPVPPSAPGVIDTTTTNTSEHEEMELSAIESAAAAAFVPAGQLPPLHSNRRKRLDIDMYAFMENFRTPQNAVRRLRIRAFLASLEPLCIPLQRLDLLACSQALKDEYPQLLTVDAYLDWLNDLPSAAFLQVVGELDALMASRAPLTQVCAVLLDACIQRYLFETHDADCTFTSRPVVQIHSSIPPCTVDLIPRLHRVMGMSLATHKNASTRISSIGNKDAIVRIIGKCFPMRSAQRKFCSVIGKLNSKQPAIFDHLRGFLACMLLGHNGVESPDEMPRLVSRIGIFKLLDLHIDPQTAAATTTSDPAKTKHKNGKKPDPLFMMLLQSCEKCIVFATREAMVRQIDLCPAIRRRMDQYVDYKSFRANVRDCTAMIRRIFRSELSDSHDFLSQVPHSGGLELVREQRQRYQREQLLEQQRQGTITFETLIDPVCEPLLSSLDMHIQTFHDAILKAGRPGSLFSFLTRLHRTVGEVIPNTQLTGLSLLTDVNRRSLESRKLHKLKSERQRQEREEQKEPPATELSQSCVSTGVTVEHCRVLDRLLQQHDPQTTSSDEMLTAVVPLLPTFVVAHPGTVWRVSAEGARALLQMRNDWYTFHSTKKAQHGAVANFSVKYPYTYAVVQTIAGLWNRQSMVQRRKLDFSVLHFQIEALTERYRCSVDQLPMVATHLWFCSVCMTIYSPLRDANHCGSKPSFGLKGAVNDFDTGLPWCYWSKEIMHTACQNQPLSALEGLGFEYTIARERYMLCPQRACAHWMVYDPRTCHPAINERGPACPSCTVSILMSQLRHLRDTHPLGPGRIFECAICYKNTGASVNTFIYGDNLMLCSKHHSPALAEFVREFLDTNGVDWRNCDITTAQVTRLCHAGITRYRQLLAHKKSETGNIRNRAILKRIKQQAAARRVRR